MTTGYTITYTATPDQMAVDLVTQGLRTFNRVQVGTAQQPFEPLCCFLHASDHSIAGGILAATYWSWLYIDALWLADTARGQGYGQQLMEYVEREARQRGATKAYLDTFSFQAPRFYQRLGYHVFGTLADFPPGQTRYFMTKQL